MLWIVCVCVCRVEGLGMQRCCLCVVRYLCSPVPTMVLCVCFFVFKERGTERGGDGGNGNKERREILPSMLFVVLRGLNSCGTPSCLFFFFAMFFFTYSPGMHVLTLAFHPARVASFVVQNEKSRKPKSFVRPLVIVLRFCCRCVFSV